MSTLIAADIFGSTPELQDFAHELGGDCRLIGPSEHPAPPAATEAEAYARFMADGGIVPYAERLRLALADPTITRAIGFSAGASALWSLLDQAQAARLSQVTLFYGSRIRDQAELVPLAPVRLVFAEHEAAFDPAPLVRRLCARGLDASVEAGSRHGFMNPRSPGFDPHLRQRQMEALRAQRNQLSNGGAALSTSSSVVMP